MIVEQIRKFVEEECKKPTSKYGYEPYTFHFIPVYNYATELAKILNADVEVVQIAALLHDIGSILEGRENHHISGARIAEEKLNELGYDKNKTELVKKCILNHRGSVKVKRGSKEEQIIADADSMSNFDNIPGIFKAAFVYENKTQGEAKKSVKTKLANSYGKLSPEAQKIIKPKYDAAMLLLS